MNESHSPDATMRLRAEPPRVTRLSRKVLAGIGFIASLCVGGALVYALQSGTGTRQGEELYSTSNRQPADGLASLPRDYTGPILGPPLPGDLGRPILDAQRKAEPVMPPAIPTPRVDEVDQHRRAEEEAARTSRVFFQAEQRGTATANASGPPANPGDLASQSSQSTGQDRQLAFLSAATDRRTGVEYRPAGPAPGVMPSDSLRARRAIAPDAPPPRLDAI